MVFTISPNKPFIKQTGLGHVLNLGVIIFSSVFIKKQKLIQTDRFRFSFLEQKLVQNGLARF